MKNQFILDPLKNFFIHAPHSDMLVAASKLKIPEWYKIENNLNSDSDVIKKIELDSNELTQLIKNQRHKNNLINRSHNTLFDIREKCIDQLNYTVQLLNKLFNENDPDWYDSLNEYLECNKWSFGSPPIGYEIYLNSFKLYIELSDYLTLEKATIIDLINSYYDNQVELTDFNNKEVSKVFENWLKIQPFEIQFEFLENWDTNIFEKAFTSRFERNENRYATQIVIGVKTASETVKGLNLFTKKILYQESKTNPESKSQIIEHKSRISELQKLKTKVRNTAYGLDLLGVEQLYVKTILDWFTDEIKLIEELEKENNSIQTSRQLPNPKVSFESFKIKKDFRIKLPLLLNELQYEFYLLNEEQNVSINDLNETLQNNRINDIEFQIGCQTNEFAYIMKKLFDMFYSLSFASIERSNLFKSKKGIQITARSLTQSLYQGNPSRSDSIDMIFNKYID